MTYDGATMVADEDRALDDESPAQVGIEGPPDTFEVELDGEVHTLPATLKGAFLRQADYTRKTQELAEHRRALEAERAAVAEAAQTYAGASQDRVRLAALEHQLKDFGDIDWEGLGAEDPHVAQRLWARYEALAHAHERLAYAVAHHEAREELRAARETAEEMAATGAALQREIDGWSPEVAGKLVEYAQAFGVTMEELSQMADARLWKLLHKAWKADAAAEADVHARAGAVRPAMTLTGGGVGGAGLRDELGAKEWIRRRNAQLAKAR